MAAGHRAPDAMAMSLSEALGLPSRDRLLPTRHSPEWGAAVRRIETWGEAPGLLAGRGVGWLWAKLQASACSKRKTWGEILDGWEHAPPQEVVRALRSSSHAPSLTIVSWNVRWLVRAGADHVKAKKEAIEARLMRGQIVCVQETHWLEHEAALWEFGLLVRDTFWSAAASGEQGQSRLGGLPFSSLLATPSYGRTTLS